MEMMAQSMPVWVTDGHIRRRKTTLLNLTKEDVDKNRRMSPRHNNHLRSRACKQQLRQNNTVDGRGDDSADSVMPLLHELANLVDGGLRHVELVISGLPETMSCSPQEVENQGGFGHLHTVRDVMKRMAMLIRGRMDQIQLRGLFANTEQTVGQAIAQAVRLCTPAASTERIDISVRLSEEVSRLPAGPVHVIVVNALRNSIQAIAGSVPVDRRWRQPGGTIELSGNMSEGFVDLCICDSGPGLDPSIIDGRGDVRFGVTTRPDGFGVGLALCRDIAVSFGGQIKLKNRSPSGVVFVFRFPVENVLCE